jgi:2-methylcitrate dehydratase
MIAIPLLFGRLRAEDYEDAIAADPRIDALRAKVRCVEDPQYTVDYHDPDKRSIPNGLTVELNDGTVLPEIAVEYPIGHRLRRAEGMPLLVEKFRGNLARRLSPAAQQAVFSVCSDQHRLEEMPVDEFADMFVV